MKYLVGYILSRVSLRLKVHPLNNLFKTIYRAVIFQLTHFYGKNVYTSSYHHHHHHRRRRRCQIGYMNHLPLFSVRPWNNSMRYMSHDDVIKWKHFPRNWPFVRRIHRSPVNSPHKGQWRGALMFSLIRVWINGWVNTREAGDLRCNRAHYDVIVMLAMYASCCITVVLSLIWDASTSCKIVVMLFYSGSDECWIVEPEDQSKFVSITVLEMKLEKPCGPDYVSLKKGMRCRWKKLDYRRISNIRRTESPNLDVSRVVLQLSLPNPIKPGVKSRMKM